MTAVAVGVTHVAEPPESSSLRQDPSWAWRSGPCVALAHRFEVCSEVGDEFPRVLGPLLSSFSASADGTAPERYELRIGGHDILPYTLQYQGRRLTSGRTVDDLVNVLAWHINRNAIEKSVGSMVLLHSAAAVRGGLTVILPADQEAGKTTTVAGLLRADFDYVTDEAVAIDPATGWVRPFPKNLSLDPGSWPLFPECRPTHATGWLRQWQVPAQRLGARALRDPVPPPKIVVFPQYVAGAETALVPVTPSEAVRELAQMSFHFPQYAARNLEVLGRLARHARAVRLVIGHLDDAVTAVEGLVSEQLMEEL